MNPKGNELQKTVKIEELATAIGKSIFEFQNMLPALTEIGFPSPEVSSEEFDIGKVLDWVGEHQALGIAILTMVTEKLTPRN